MSILYILKMNCKEATYLHEKGKESKLSFSEKVGLKLHLLFCSICKLFYKQMDEVSKCVHHASKNSTATLPDEAKLKMQRALNDIQ